MAKNELAAPETAQNLLKKLQALAEANELATAKEYEKIKALWDAAPREEAENAQFAALGDPLAARFAADAEKEKQIIEKSDALTAQLAALCEANDMEKLRSGKAEIEKAIAGLGRLPREAAKRYQDIHRKAGEMLSLHFATLDYARWESYTLKLDICKELEKLNEAKGSELPGAARKLQELRAKWKTLGSVPKEKLEESNQRFLELTRKLKHRIDEYFSGRRQAQKESAAAKTQLCIEAEALQNSTEWRATSEKIKAMQSQWKTLPHCGSQEGALFQRFHAAADAFFQARSLFYREMESKYAIAVKAREALIAEAQNLQDVRTAKALREKYKAGQYAGREEIRLQKLFDEAMEKFFRRRQEEFAKRDTESETLIAELKTLTADPLPHQQRAAEIAEKLHRIANRHTFDAERKAKQEFDAAFAKAQKERIAKVQKESAAACDTWLKLYFSFCAGDAVTLPEIPESLPKIAPMAKNIAAAISGDAAAKEKVEHTLLNTQKEAEKILAELENAAGCTETKPLDLAAELQAAIIGNSGFGSARKEKKDYKREFAAFEAILWLAPNVRQELQARFDTIKKSLAQ